jgi:hypothetical protein
MQDSVFSSDEYNPGLGFIISRESDQGSASTQLGLIRAKPSTQVGLILFQPQRSKSGVGPISALGSPAGPFKTRPQIRLVQSDLHF